jgi:hypothetical protein
MQKILIGILCLLSFSSYSQDLADKVKSEIESFHRRGIDTTIIFFVAFVHTGFPRKVKGLGDTIMIFDSDYIFYKENGKGMLIACIDYVSEDGTYTDIAVSKPFPVNCDSLFDYSLKRLDDFDRGYVFPFVYRIPWENDSVYIPLKTSHPSNFDVAISAGTYHSSQSFKGDDFDTNAYTNGPRNLNYPHNISTVTYKLYNMLQETVDKVRDELFFVGTKKK